jgi:hypothetical protein
VRRKKTLAAVALVQTPTDALAMRIARRCVAIIEFLLRPEEIGEAMREFHAAIAEELAAGCETEGTQ